MNSLLIGNGLNLTNYSENSFLSPREVFDRFKENIKVYWEVINKLVYLNDMDLDKLLSKLDHVEGIEAISGKTKGRFSL